MAWGLRASTPANNAGTSTSPATVTLGAAVSLNDVIVVNLAMDHGGSADPVITSVGDDLGNSYSQAVITAVWVDGTFHNLLATYIANVTVAGTPTISVVFDATTADTTLTADAYTGVQATTDGSATKTQTTSQTSVTTNATGATTAANELVVGGCFGDSGGKTITALGGDTLRTSSVSGAHGDGGLADKDSGGSGSTPTLGFTFSAAEATSGATVIVLKLSGGGGTQYYSALPTLGAS